MTYSYRSILCFAQVAYKFNYKFNSKNYLMVALKYMILTLPTYYTNICSNIRQIDITLYT